MTLRKPPKAPQGAHVIGRLVGLVILLAAFGVIIWTLVTNQQAAAIERSDPLNHAPGVYQAADSETTLHIQQIGTGPNETVLIHGDIVIGGSALMDVAGSLAAEGRRVTVPDLLGFGFSPRPTEPGRRLTITGQAEILAGLLDELELTAVELVGFGWGGEVASELAVSRPDLVSRLVLVDIPGLPVPRTGWQTLASMPFGLGEAVAFTNEGGSARAANSFVAECPAWTDCDDPDVRELYRRAAEVPGTARSIWARRATENAAVAPASLDEVTVPVEVVVVDGDRTVAEDVAMRFSSAEVEVSTATPSTLVDTLAD